MKRLLLATCLLLSSWPGHGGARVEPERKWQLVTLRNDILPPGAKLYIDLSTFRFNDDNLRSMSNLFDYTTAQPSGEGESPHLSKQELRIYDCTGKRFRFREANLYLDHMGTGNLVGVRIGAVWSISFEDLGDREPRFIEEALVKLVCSVKLNPVLGWPAP